MVSLLLMAGLSFVSCSDDGGGSTGWNTGGSSLAGTTWRSYDDPLDGEGLHFITLNQVQFIEWSYSNGHYDDKVEFVASYEYNAPSGVISAYEESFNFTVSGDELTLYGSDGEYINYKRK